MQQERLAINNPNYRKAKLHQTENKNRIFLFTPSNTSEQRISPSTPTIRSKTPQSSEPDPLLQQHAPETNKKEVRYQEGTSSDANKTKCWV